MGGIRKQRKRYTGIADLEEQSVRLFHLYQDDFPGISFETNISIGKKVAGEEIIDHRGKLRLDQNDEKPLPNANLNMGHSNGIDADTVDTKHASEMLLRNGSQSLQDDLPVNSGKKIDGIDISQLTDHIYCSEIDEEFSTFSNSYAKCVGFCVKRRAWHKYLKAEFELRAQTGLTAYARLKVTDGIDTIYSNAVQTSSSDTWEKRGLSIDISSFDATTVLEMSIEYHKSAIDDSAKIRRIEMFLSQE